MRIIGGGWPQRITTMLRVFHEEIRGAGKRKRNVVADYSRAHKRQSFTAFKCWRRRWNYATQYISKRGCVQNAIRPHGGAVRHVSAFSHPIFSSLISLYWHSGSKWLGQVSKCGLICNFFWVQQIAYFNGVLAQKNYELWKIQLITSTARVGAYLNWVMIVEKVAHPRGARSACTLTKRALA